VGVEDREGYRGIIIAVEGTEEAMGVG